MSIVISQIFSKGNQNGEQIIFEVKEDCDLGDYLLADDTFANGKPSNKLRNMYPFPAIAARKGEFVQLFTRKGEYRKVLAADKKTTYHQLYWGLDKAVWNDSGDCAHLMLAPRAKRTHKQAPN